MRVRRLSPKLWPLTMAMFMLLSSALANLAQAQDGPHGNYTALTDACAACHRTHTAVGSRLLRSTDQGNTFCNSCHNGTDAPAVSTHANQDFSGGAEAPFELNCLQCHEPHGSTNLYNIRESVVVSSTIGITTGPVVFTAETGADSFDEVDTDNPDIDDICVTCHINSNNPGYPMTNHEGGDHGGADYRGLACTTCHPHDQDGDPTTADGFMASCLDCHGQPPDGVAYPNRDGSHTTHFTPTAFGPQIELGVCTDCHLFSAATHNDGQATFTDGQPLATTTACDGCHSPGGTYNGVNDPAIGAKDNWRAGVYSGTNLVSGKEQWCAGCHDESPSVIQSVNAPNVIGDEDANTRYGTGYGYYRTGHGLASNQFYPASGAPGAGIDCLDCHNSEMQHIDGLARTYTPDSDYLTYDPVSANYQAGFRLRDVSTGYDGQYPLHIPRTGNVFPPGFREDWEFALCFECHNRDALLGDIGDPNTETNFRDEPLSGGGWNSHNLHTDGRNGPGGPETPQYDSDFDGTADSRLSCPACHNVHGSSAPAMFRRGELAIATSPVVGLIPFLDFQYVPTCGPTGCTTLADSAGGAGTRFYASGAGTVGRNGICNMCHNEYWFDGTGGGSDHTGYRRAPVDVTIPNIAWVHGEVGSNVLLVRLSEGVYSDSGAVGDLTPADFRLIDVDNGRAITNVAHTAGDAVATLILSIPLDGTDDLDTDTLAAATATSIYDALGNAMNTNPVTISGDANPPIISDQNPANGTADVTIDSNLIFTLSDNESGVDWTTFSITLSGDGGYFRTYTDADTGVVSRTGTPASYEVTINPDADFGQGETISVTVNVDDLAGNALVPPVWSFTTATGAGPQTMVLYPSDVASNNGFTTAGGSWADILDNNDGDASYAHACCGPAGQYFYVDLDDPTGLAGATIESITISVYARYLEGQWPGALPYAGNIDIGYRTGTNIIWTGNTVTDTSGNYNLIQSATFTSDSDGGTLDLTDIDNLQITVSRGAFGPPQVRVTQVYAEIVYSPQAQGGALVPVEGAKQTVYLPVITK